MMVIRIWFLCVTIFATVVAQSVALANAPSRPNVILIMADDQGWGETGYHSHPHLKTPVLDEMASRGLRMDRFYAAHVMLANADECPYGPSPHSVWRIWSQLVHAT